MSKSRSKKPAPSPALESAQVLVRRLLDLARVLDDLNASAWDSVRRGRAERFSPGDGFLAVLEDAQLSEEERRRLVTTLQKLQDRARTYVAAIGDDRRRRGQAVPLCWLPPDSGV
jgi:hypothetical protein